MLNRHKWHLTSHGYVGRTDPGGDRIYLHREVNRTPSGMQTDHIDGNRLRNTRENLRSGNDSQNGANQRKRSNTTSSRFKGVCFIASRGKRDTNRWVAYVTLNQKRHHLGHFVSEMDAALAYNIKAKELFGEFAKLNDLPLDFLRERAEPKKFQFRASKYKGVSYNKSLKYWTARIVRDGTLAHHSYHKTEELAAQAYQSALTTVGENHATASAVAL